MLGKVIIYTGNGEGKTTAAIGHAIRFAGYGKKVAILHFMKGRKTGEFKFLEKNNLIDVHLFGPPFFLITSQATLGGWLKGIGIEFVSVDLFTGKKKNKVVADKLINNLRACSFEAHLKKAKKGMEFANKLIKEKRHKLIILDEILYAIKFKLVKEDDVISLIERRKNVHIILTGRYASERIIKLADLVTYLEEGKHYFYEDKKTYPSLDY
ncbi:MAG TPA: cob(I)yrinic acid a,c-diamide adenosyltransferase [Candidatus Aenigmarchaeota archaeon]|nr:cob(I)yrinic acid a,c-diamide adenosyltransferase [Candidatus Aenigmarchaeota archaeon]